jgi:hypothetical protein
VKKIQQHVVLYDEEGNLLPVVLNGGIFYDLVGVTSHGHENGNGHWISQVCYGQRWWEVSFDHIIEVKSLQSIQRWLFLRDVQWN